jgi:outer membrane protein assembly factor BamB
LPPILTSAGGRPLVISGGKAGKVIAWNRRTRKRIWTTLVGLHRHDTGPLPARPVEVCPGLLGGVLTPMAVANGRVFVPVVNLCMRGSATGYEPLAGVDIDARGRGQLTALNVTTGRKLWTRSLPSPAFGCATAAGAAVFTTTYSGRVYGLDQRTGRALWSAQEPAGINACPAVGDGLLVVPAGASPTSIRTPTPVVDAYAIRSRP